MAAQPPTTNAKDRLQVLLVKGFCIIPLLASGVAIAFALYRNLLGIPFYWVYSTPFAPLVAVIIGVFSAIILIVWILHSLGKLRFRFDLPILMSVSLIWIGFGAGLLGPVVLGRDGAWVRHADLESVQADLESVQSVVYDITLSRLTFPEELEGFVGKSFGPYATSESLSRSFVVLNSAGTTFLEVSTTEFVTGRVALALISSLTPTLEVADWVVLTDLNPSIQNVRDLQVIDTGLAFSNVELKNGSFVLQVWRLDLQGTSLQNVTPTKLWESEPGLSWYMSPTGKIALNQSGGRIVVGPSGGFLVTVGDFNIGLSINDAVKYQGRPDALGPLGSYGKIIRVNPDGSSDVISSGHRNPQGLFFDNVSERLWSTEHGPNAGGELNLITEGKDYGWPDVTYGTPYDGEILPKGNWEIGRWASRHEGFEKPRLSWMPSVGPSQLLVYGGAEFPAWQGDILVATMRDESIRRIRLDGDRVVFDERIEIGKRDSNFRRIRDMVELVDGRLLLTFDSGELAVLSLDNRPQPQEEK